MNDKSLEQIVKIYSKEEKLRIINLFMAVAKISPNINILEQSINIKLHVIQNRESIFDAVTQLKNENIVIPVTKNVHSGKAGVWHHLNSPYYSLVEFIDIYELNVIEADLSNRDIGIYKNVRNVRRSIKNYGINKDINILILDYGDIKIIIDGTHRLIAISFFEFSEEIFFCNNKIINIITLSQNKESNIGNIFDYIFPAESLRIKINHL